MYELILNEFILTWGVTIYSYTRVRYTIKSNFIFAPGNHFKKPSHLNEMQYLIINDHSM